MIKDLLSNSFAVQGKTQINKLTEWVIWIIVSTSATSVTDPQSAMLKSLISRAGDKSKNNDRLKFALVSIRFPEAYNESM